MGTAAYPAELPGSLGLYLLSQHEAAFGVCTFYTCARVLAYTPASPSEKKMSYSNGGEEGGCGGMFLADTMNTLYFLEALIFSCYLSFYKPMSMRTADLKMVLGQVTRVKFLATYEASIL